jgi:hypothetical protein
MTRVSDTAIVEPGIAQKLEDWVEHMDAEALQSSRAKNIAENIKGVVSDLGISLETPHSINF